MAETCDIGSATRHASLSSPEWTLAESFLVPPATHGPVPFYWWTGETLERGRLARQLDQLRERGVRQTIVSYPHHPDGSSNLGDPPLFSPDWWDLFRWFLGACRERGMTVGFQDYTLVEPILQSIGHATPGMQGGQMSCIARSVAGGCRTYLEVESGSLVIGAWAYPVIDGPPRTAGRIPLLDSVRDGKLDWCAPAGDWWVAVVFARPNAFDPLHPDAGMLAVDKLYTPFERECPGEVGETLNLFFQDELNFGCRMPYWSNHLFDAFFDLKSYDLYPLLPALWHDFGDQTEKIRIDYADVVTRRAEACYFEPVFRWHEERCTLFGHDNCGRGGIAEGRSFYGDYFRTMRWYGAPGCDDPKLQGPRAFKGLKVNSSIAHLYQRPRVWIEAFHSSGWGTSPADVVAAIQEDFAYGATVVNLHGLYYTTFGGWWEWAPPDFHFRQPYWHHAGSLNDFFTRTCWLLSQGVHRCDVGIVYPVTALDAQAADPSPDSLVAHTGNLALGGPENPDPQPEDSAFQLGKHLFDRNCDFDFLDFESIERATATGAALQVAGSDYRVLLFPAMPAARFSTLEKARDLVRAGGVVIAYGCLPKASDRAGRNDPALDAIIGEIFGSTSEHADLEKSHPGGGRAFFIRSGRARVLEAIDSSIQRDIVSTAPLHVRHLRIGNKEVYYLFNPAPHPLETTITLRESGRTEHWNAWTGRIDRVSADMPLLFFARESKLLVVHRDEMPAASPAACVAPAETSVVELDGPWDFEVIPTLDNRFGDFSQPPTPELLGPQARRFEYADDFGDGPTHWRVTTYSFGPRLEASDALPPQSDFAAIEASLLECRDHLGWQPYPISLRWGIERDPFLTDWLSGPHGLKCRVPDEYLDFHSDTPGTTWYLRAKVIAARAGQFTLVTGARCVYQVWVNGTSACRQQGALPPGFHAPWNIPHYECETRETRVTLREGENDLIIKLVQSDRQRTRAFVAFDPPPETPHALALRWFTDPAKPRPCLPAPDSRKAIHFRFTSPPGMREMSFVSRGPATARLGDVETPLVLLERRADGCHQYQAMFDPPVSVSVSITLRVEAPRESNAGDALPEPVRFTCGRGRISLGDWAEHGLASYSGLATYSRTFEIRDLKCQTHLDLGHLAATAEIRVNGQTAATLVAPPWRCDLTPHLVAGNNQLAITVANTLASHYRVGNPSPYVFEHQTPCGLFGPVRLITIQS